MLLLLLLLLFLYNSACTLDLDIYASNFSKSFTNLIQVQYWAEERQPLYLA